MHTTGYRIIQRIIKLTAFEANGRLLQFKRIPFGLTNAVGAFQRTVTQIIKEDGLVGVYPYLDDVSVAGNTLEELRDRSMKFESALKKRKMTLNEDKTVREVKKMTVLGYEIENGRISPDKDRLQPLLELAEPKTLKELKQVRGLFAYYAKWIVNFSTKIRPLIDAEIFPLSDCAKRAFQTLKKDLADVALMSIDEDRSFVLETDASNVAISATLNQDGKPVAFFSRTLNKSQKMYPTVEKEAMSIVEAIRHWSHFLRRKKFKLITDQKAVAYMFDNFKKSKIKNVKIQNWRLELSEYRFDVEYRPGRLNSAADALTRNTKAKICGQISSISIKDNLLEKLHKEMGCPGITRLFHQVKIRNLPYSLADVTKICKSCLSCSELKPKFYRPSPGKLIHATQPFERIAVDFKGPLPKSKTSKNRYILTIVDEFSRFPWAFAVKDTSSNTVMKIYHELFATFGTPSTIHSDKGSGFISTSMRRYLNEMGINISTTTPYHPQGNGQCEKFNGTIWKTVRLLMHSHKLDISNWEEMLPTALHSIRSLLNTSTNCTPHERLFNYQRRPGSIGSKILPSWLINPGPVLLRNFERSNKNDELVKKVELLEANPHYAVVKDQKGITKTVSVKDLAPYPRNVIQNSNDILQLDFDDLAIEAANADPKVSIPKLSIPESILRSSNAKDHSVTSEGSSSSSNNEIENSESENEESSSNARERITKSGRISRAPTKFEDEY